MLLIIFMGLIPLTIELTIHKFFAVGCQQFFFGTACLGGRASYKKSLTDNNQFYTVVLRIIERITKWCITFQTALLTIIGIIFIVPVCLGCAEKIKKIAGILNRGQTKNAHGFFIFWSRECNSLLLVESDYSSLFIGIQKSGFRCRVSGVRRANARAET